MANLIRRPSSSLGLSAFEEFDKLFDNFWQMPTSFNNTIRMPSLDIYSEDDKHMVVEMQAPGFNQDDIDINIRNGILEIRGETSSSNEQKDKKRSYMMRESHASFARRVVLPEGANADNISAELDKGILKITVPVDRPKAKKIEITAKSQDRAKKLASAN
jgi:HSP20 family protein